MSIKVYVAHIRIFVVKHLVTATASAADHKMGRAKSRMYSTWPIAFKSILVVYISCYPWCYTTHDLKKKQVTVNMLACVNYKYSFNKYKGSAINYNNCNFTLVQRKLTIILCRKSLKFTTNKYPPQVPLKMYLLLKLGSHDKHVYCLASEL